MNKLGVSHLEIILSFVIFIGFVTFLMIVIPINRSETRSSGLNAAERGIINYTTSGMFSFSLIINDTRGYCFQYAMGHDIPWQPEWRMVVRNESGDIVNASAMAGYLRIETGGRFYTLYFSEEFEERLINYDITCDSYAPEDIELGLRRETVPLGYSKILELNRTYYEDYQTVHDELNIPDREDFGFVLSEINGEPKVYAVKEIPSNVEIYPREKPVEVIFNNGTQRSMMLYIETW